MKLFLLILVGFVSLVICQTSDITVREWFDGNEECSGEPYLIRVQYSDMCMIPACVRGVLEKCHASDEDALAMPGTFVIYNMTDGSPIWRWGWKPGCYQVAKTLYQTIECTPGQTPELTYWDTPTCVGTPFTQDPIRRRGVHPFNVTCP